MKLNLSELISFSMGAKYIYWSYDKEYTLDRYFLLQEYTVINVSYIVVRSFLVPFHWWQSFLYLFLLIDIILFIKFEFISYLNEAYAILYMLYIVFEIQYKSEHIHVFRCSRVNMGRVINNCIIIFSNKVRIITSI